MGQNWRSNPTLDTRAILAHPLGRSGKALDKLTGGAARQQADDSHFTAVLHDIFPLRRKRGSGRVGRVVTALDIQRGPDGPNDLPRRLRIEEADEIDALECSQNRRPIVGRVDWPAGTFQPSHRLVAVESNGQRIAEGTRGLQVVNVSRMKQIETT